MGFCVDVGELVCVARRYRRQVEKIQEQLDQCKRSFNAVVSSNAFSGRTGQAITDGVNNYHATVLVGFHRLYTIVLVEYLQTLEEFRNIVDEHDDQAVLTEDILVDAAGQLSGFGSAKAELDTRFKAIYNRVDDLVDLPVPSAGYERCFREARKILDETRRNVYRFAAKKKDSDAELLLKVLLKRVEVSGKMAGLGFTDSRLQGFYADSVLADVIEDVDGQVRQAERLAREQEERLLKQYQREHPVEGLINAVTDWFGDRWGGLVSWTRSWPDGIGFLKQVVLGVEGVLAFAGDVVSGSVLGVVGAGRLVVSGVLFSGGFSRGVVPPAWVTRDMVQAGRVVSQGWSRVCAWGIVSKVVSGRGVGGVSEAMVSGALGTVAGDVLRAQRAVSGFDGYDWGRVAGEVGSVFIPVAGPVSKVVGAGRVVAGVSRLAPGVAGVASKLAGGVVSRLAPGTVGRVAGAGFSQRWRGYVEALLPEPGIPGQEVKRIRAIKPDDEKNIFRPAVSEYLSSGYVAEHRGLFEEGVAAVARDTKRIEKEGRFGREDGAFVFPRQVVVEMVRESGGDVRKLERLLGLDQGSLGDAPVLVEVPEPKGLRIPDGNEKGSMDNKNWRPGGKTHPGRIPEAVIDPPLGSEVVTSRIKF